MTGVLPMRAGDRTTVRMLRSSMRRHALLWKRAYRAPRNAVVVSDGSQHLATAQSMRDAARRIERGGVQ